MATRPLAIRLELSVLEELDRAAKQVGMKPSAFAKEAILEKLGATEKERTAEELETLTEQVEVLRHELALATEGILFVAGRENRQTDEEALENAASWVKKRFPKRGEAD